MSSHPQHVIERAIHRLADPDSLIQDLGPARAATLNDGLAGTALALAVLADGDPALAPAANRHWDAAAHLLKGCSPDGIHRGPGALATSLVLGNPYLPAAHRKDAEVGRAVGWLSARACGIARHQYNRLRQGHQGTPWAVYDAIKGLSGIGRILLAAAHSGHHKAAEPGLKAALTTLTGMINTPPAPNPGWWLPQHEHHLATATPIPASGAATTGLAHGIAGPLAFLAIAAAHGHAVPGQSDAVTTAATWLLNRRTHHGTWPAHVPGNILQSPNAPAPLTRSRRDPWCYGNAGIGNALIHAGTATHEETFTDGGRFALEVIARRSPQQWDTYGAGICHGTAGVLLTADAHHHTHLRRQARDATVFLSTAAGADPTRADPGLLTGTAGTALALSRSDRHSDGLSWTAMLLLT
jgi:hypothetical protein